MTSSEDGSCGQDGSKKRRGMYAKNACQRCRLCKKKCDGNEPCSKCVAAGPDVAQACIIIEKSKTRPNRKKRRTTESEASVKTTSADSSSPPNGHHDTRLDDERLTPSLSYLDTQVDISEEDNDHSLHAAGGTLEGAAQVTPPGFNGLERAITASFTRRELMAAYGNEVAVLASPVELSKIDDSMKEQYENQWWEGAVDHALHVCQEVYAAMALNARKCSSDGALILARAEHEVAEFTGVPNIALVSAAMTIAGNHLCFAPRKAAFYARIALDLIPRLRGVDATTMTIFRRQATFFSATTNNNMTLKEKAACYAGKSMSADEADALMGEIWAGRVILDDAVSKLRASLIPLLFKVVGVTNGLVIRNVSKVLSRISLSPDIRTYGILNSRPEEPSDNHYEFLEWYGDGSVMALLGRYIAVLGLAGDYARSTAASSAMLRRWEMILRQLTYTCRVLTCVILHCAGSAELAAKCAFDFIMKSLDQDFSSAAIGAYVIPVAMMVEYAFQSGNVELMEGVISHAVRLLEAWTPFQDERREELVAAAMELLQLMKGGG